MYEEEKLPTISIMNDAWDQTSIFYTIQTHLNLKVSKKYPLLSTFTTSE